jgi:hypothetical protein
MYRAKNLTLLVVAAFFATLAAVSLMASAHIAYGATPTGGHEKISLTAPPGAPYKKVSELVKLPDYLPGMGTLYVDPKNLPVGPYLGYDHAGKLVDIIYMVPLDELNAHKAFPDLGASVAGLRVNHTELTYNPGHPGLEKPHYHITEWLISEAAEKAMK